MNDTAPILNLFLEEDMPEPVTVALPGAEVVICSRPKPPR